MYSVFPVKSLHTIVRGVYLQSRVVSLNRCTCVYVTKEWGRGGCGRISDISDFRYTMIHQSRGGSHTGGSVVITDAPVCICDQGREGCGRVRTRSLSFDYDDTCCLFLLQLDCVRVWCLG